MEQSDYRREIDKIDDQIVDLFAQRMAVAKEIAAYKKAHNLPIRDGGREREKMRAVTERAPEDMKEYTVNMLQSCFNMAGIKVETSGDYGGWDPNPDSEILNLLRKIYKEQNGKDALVQVDHAGLECSVILGKYPNLDVVSLGPTLRSPHTTTERCLIPTVEPFWRLLTQALEEVAEK